MTKLHFGCGRKIMKDFINVDVQDTPNIDKSFDFNSFPYPFPENYFTYVFTENVLEHLLYPTKVMNELRRICKNKAIIHISVPMWNHTFAYNDPEHFHYFNERSIEIMCGIESTYLNKVEEKFKIIKLKKISTGWRRFLPRFIRNIMDKFLINTFSNMIIDIEVVKLDSRGKQKQRQWLNLKGGYNDK